MVSTGSIKIPSLLKRWRRTSLVSHNDAQKIKLQFFSASGGVDRGAFMLPPLRRYCSIKVVAVVVSLLRIAAFMLSFRSDIY